MATYAVGDVQGCWETLQKLLARLGFDPAADRLLLLGDLVNRGPLSLEVLRFAAAHEGCVESVLGNHDLHLLSRARGQTEPARGDTLDALLAAPDREPLLDWLRARPFVLRAGDATLFHAGLLPEWSADDALELGAELSATLAGPEGDRLLADLRGTLPPRWDAAPTGRSRRALAAAALTRLRMCAADGAPRFDFKGPPEDAPPGWRPWYELPERRSAGARLVFAHWAALGFLSRPGLAALDTGCVWGGTLTALRLEDGAVVQQPCADAVTARRARG